MTAKQILEVVEKNYSVNSFARGEWMKLNKDSEVKAQLADFEPQQKYKDDFLESVKREAELVGVDFKETEGFVKYREIPSKWDAYKQTILGELGLGRVVEVERYDGEGDTWYSIKHFVDHDVYIKTKGYYQSHHGTEFDHGYGHEVRPQQQTITVFR